MHCDMVFLCLDCCALLKEMKEKARKRTMRIIGHLFDSQIFIVLEKRANSLFDDKVPIVLEQRPFREQANRYTLDNEYFSLFRYCKGRRVRICGS